MPIELIYQRKKELLKNLRAEMKKKEPRMTINIFSTAPSDKVYDSAKAIIKAERKAAGDPLKKKNNNNNNDTVNSTPIQTTDTKEKSSGIFGNLFNWSSSKPSK